MFFSLARTIDKKFPCHYQLGRLTLNVDQGWIASRQDRRIYISKGYLENRPLQSSLTNLQDEMGNFCVFDYDLDTDLITLKTNRYRSFPLWFDRDAITNLKTLPGRIWADSLITIDQNLTVGQQIIDAIGPIDTSIIDRQSLVDAVHERLRTRISQFFCNNDLPIRVFCSGGIDSMLVFSYIKTITDRFEMVFMNHLDWDDFWCHNGQHLKDSFWGYRQIHHWNEPTILTSGAPGDEFMLRSPMTGNLLLLEHNTSIMEQVRSRGIDSCLHGQYFSRPVNLELFCEQERNHQPATDRKTFFWNLCNIVLNDHQHWHLGKTLTFTPLLDLEIFKMFLRLPLEHAIDQLLDSGISLELIHKNDPDLLNYLSDQKNTHETLSNLTGLMHKYSATSGQ